MNSYKRWVLLEHIGAPDDSIGLHYDLLLEDLCDCRTWKLNSLLILDGPIVEARKSHPHHLNWLKTSGRLVSNGRGWAHPVESGYYKGCLPKALESKPVLVELIGKGFSGILEIQQNFCVLKSS